MIVKELKDVQKEFGDERRTEIIEDTGEIRLEDLVAVEDVAVTVTRGGYLKRTAVDTYRRQTRGGKGRIGMGTRAEDFVEHLIVASTHSYLLIFTDARPRLLAEDLRDPGRHHDRQGQAHLQPHQPAAGRDREGVPFGEGFRARPVHRDGDQARRHQEIAS